MGLDDLLNDLGGFEIPNGGPTEAQRAELAARVIDAANDVAAGTSWKEALADIVSAAFKAMA